MMKRVIYKVYQSLMMLLSIFILISCDNGAAKKEVLDAASNDVSEIRDPLARFEIVKFGKYEQDDNLNNGKEDIEWLVIDEKDDRKLLLSKYVLDAVPYDTDITISEDSNRNNPRKWNKSYLRSWLNKDFFESAFNDSEKSSMMLNLVESGKVYGVNNSYTSDDMGTATNDMVYILSKDEIREYLGFEINGHSDTYLASPTKFAVKQLNSENKSEQIAIWHKEKEYSDAFREYSEYWIRSPGYLYTMSDYEFTALIVEKDGHLSSRTYPYYVYDKIVNEEQVIEKEHYYLRGIRPVISIKNVDNNKSDIEVKITDENNSTAYLINDIDKMRMVSDYDNSLIFTAFDEVLFGSYEQDGNIQNGKEPIEWLLLYRDDNKALLISKHILDYLEYSVSLDRHITWKESSLRAYANNNFYNSAFGDKDKLVILSNKYMNYDNPVYSSSEEAETIDKVSVLSFDEVMKYFDIDYSECVRDIVTDYKVSSSNKLATSLTNYALKKLKSEKLRIKTSRENDFWLRNQGRSGEELFDKYNSAMYARETVDLKGAPYDIYSIEDPTHSMRNYKLGFRPIIWVDINLIKNSG